MDMIRGEVGAFVCALAAGIMLRALYGMIRLKRSLLPTGKVLSAMEDLLYWFVCTGVLFVMWQEAFFGIPRAYGYVAVILGMWLFYKGPEQLIFKVFVKYVADPLKKRLKLITLKAKMRREEVRTRESEDKVKSKGT